MANQIWVVRAGEKAAFIDDFIEQGNVAIGWKEASKVDESFEKKQIDESLQRCYPNETPGTIASWASQIKRFYSEIKIGDYVASYDPNQRLYFLGKIQSGVEILNQYLCRARKVEWTHQVSRDALETATKNSLGAIGTLFRVRDKVAGDLWNNALIIGSDPYEKNATLVNQTLKSDDAIAVQEVISKASDLIEDRIAKLTWEQMQELVKEVLDAMGYRARVSPKGADRGIDIFASPDGLGLQEPRIFVEVKHRLGSSMSSSEIRSFLGGRQPGDRCLYVSTGGFTKDAKYEAERSTTPLTLISLPQLAELVIENYDSFSTTGKSLIPLERLYWPV